MILLRRNLIFSSQLNQLLSNKLSKSKQFSLIYQKHIHKNLSNDLNRYFFSYANETKSQRNLIMPQLGYLSIRNSETLEFAFVNKSGKDNILIGKNSTVGQISDQIKQNLEANKIKIVCNEGLPISILTPVEALINRFFFVIVDDMYSFKVEGQLLRPVYQNLISQSFRNLQLPLFIRRQIQHYCQRINKWTEAKYGVGIQNTNVKIPKNQAKKIIINAAIDPLESSKKMLQLEEQFQKIYWQVQEMLDKKSEAAILCSKMVRNRMSLGLFFILANIGFIWSGTYIFYSWDIIEPIAYFISSLAGIILFSRFFKIKKPFSLANYKNYMVNKYMSVASKKIGFLPQDLQNKQRILIQLESEIKDYYFKKM